MELGYNSIFGVSLNDYADGSVFAGEGTGAELAELQKAMEAGDITGMQTLGKTDVPGATLKVEDLESTLKVLTFKESDIKLWKKISKLPAYNTVEEYNQQVEYGSDGHSFVDEGGLPEDDSPIYRRQAELVKFLGTTRSVSHPMQLVSTMVGNLIESEVKNGTLKILRDADRALWNADSDVIPQEFNGYKKQQIKAMGSEAAWIDSDCVIDLHGGELTEAVFENGALNILQNNGEGNLFMCPPKVISAFKKNLLDQKRIYVGATDQNVNPTAGLQVQKYLSQFGFVDLDFDKFLAETIQFKTLTSAASSAKAPVKPTAGATPAEAVTDANNTLFGGDQAGAYKYAVSAITRAGESQLTDLSSAAISVATGQSVDLQFTAGDANTVGYKIYRTKKGETTNYYCIARISAAQLAAGVNGAAAGKFRDKNYKIAGTEDAFLIDNSVDVWAFKQLAPLMKMDLAVLSPATRFMILLYGTPVLYAPKKMVTFKNIKVD
jgi:hypothetical protein